MTTISYSRSGNPQERMSAAGSPPAAGHIRKGVGFAAATAAGRQGILTRAEIAPCTCPEHCERDHTDG